MFVPIPPFAWPCKSKFVESVKLKGRVFAVTDRGGNPALSRLPLFSSNANVNDGVGPGATDPGVGAPILNATVASSIITVFARSSALACAASTARWVTSSVGSKAGMPSVVLPVSMSISP